MPMITIVALGEYMLTEAPDGKTLDVLREVLCRSSRCVVLAASDDEWRGRGEWRISSATS